VGCPLDCQDDGLGRGLIHFANILEVIPRHHEEMTLMRPPQVQQRDCLSVPYGTASVLLARCQGAKDTLFVHGCMALFPDACLMTPRDRLCRAVLEQVREETEKNQQPDGHTRKPGEQVFAHR
jgi:hypothetical protein